MNLRTAIALCFLLLGSASEIDQVQVGAEALVELTSVNRRRSMPIEGRVKSLSTEQMTDAVSGTAYYQAYIELDRTSIQQQGMLLQPGMSTYVMIRTAPRSPIEYLLQPVSRNFIAASAQE